MKGTIVKCLQEMTEARQGKEAWVDALEQAGLTGPQFFTLSSDVEDAQALALFGAVGDVLGISPGEVADAFGDHWVNTYAPRVYQTLYARLGSAREFILALDGVHQMVTNTIPNAHPPRFEYEERDERTLIVTYKSRRGLIDLYIGLARGVGRYFGTPLQVSKLSNTQVKIVFP